LTCSDVVLRQITNVTDGPTDRDGVNGAV